MPAMILSCETLESLTDPNGLTRKDRSEMRAMTCPKESLPSMVTESELKALDDEHSLDGDKDPKTSVLMVKEIVGVIRKGVPEIRTCYEKLLVRKKKAQGRVKVKFVIGSSGRVEKSCIDETSTALYPVLWRCVIDVTNKSVFPKPRGGKKVTITYPYVFYLLI